MSHFNVPVIGPDPKKQLQPYHEFECTGFDDEYVQEVDITDKILEMVQEGTPLLEALYEYMGDEHIVSSEEEVDRSDTHKYRFAIVRDGKLIKAVKRTNPNAKWDGWVCGGRWSGFFLDTTGKQQNAVYKEYWALDKQKEQAALEAGEFYDRVHRIAGFPIPKWSEIREKHAPNIGAAGEEYQSTPAMKNLLSHRDFHPFTDWDEFTLSREEYIQNRVNRTGVPHAVLKDGKWYQRGEMGWWGTRNDEMTEQDWNAWVHETLAELPGSTELYIIDCHI